MVIAHRICTIWDADRIVFVGEGKVLEIVDHDSIMSKPNGQYQQLRWSTLDYDILKEFMGKNDDENYKAVDYEAEIKKEAEGLVDVLRARSLVQED